MQKNEIYDKILDQVRVSEGDIIDVSSDLIRFALYFRRIGLQFDPNFFIDKLQEKVTSEGTLLVRTWNWDFCKGKSFDYRNTPSQVGSLGDVVLSRNDFRRSKHPIYSFAVWGKHQQVICEMDNKSAWGADSPFAFITEKNGKQLMFGSTMFNSLTHVHYVEECVGVDYRFIKDFQAQYIDEFGNVSIKTYSMNVRKLELKIKMTSENFSESFYNSGILTTSFFENIPISVVLLKDAFEVIKHDIISNSSKTFCCLGGRETDD